MIRKSRAAAAALAVLFFLLPCLSPARGATGVSAADKTVYLTFDDGPTDSTTPYVLDILQEKQVPATFFVIGRQIRGREAILRRLADEGHSIGIHSFTHIYSEIYASPAALLQDIELCREAIRGVLPQYRGTLYRFPGGSFGLRPELIEAVKSKGYTPYDWNASVGDAEGPPKTADLLLQNALTTSTGKNRVILLLHDGVRYNETIRCLPGLIDAFAAEGYRFDRLPCE